MLRSYDHPITIESKVLLPEYNTNRLWAIIITVSVILAYSRLFSALVKQWLTDDEVAHGIFVPIVAAWAVWEKRHAVRTAVLRPSNLGLVLMAWGGVQAVLSDLAAELYLSRIAFLISLVGLLAFLRGWATVRVLSFPLALLLFMFPIPGVLYREVTFPLQLLASRLAETSLDLIGYTVIREGNLLELAGQRLSVVEACSGVRSLLTLGFFAVSYAWFVDSRGWTRWVLLAMTAPIAVLANAGRIVVTAVVGEYDQELAYGTFHAVSGWGILILAIVLLILTHSLMLLVESHTSRGRKVSL